MKEIWIKILELIGLAFWVEIVTENPQCTYYFGPFVSQEEAEAAQGGYIEDLESEGALGIAVTVKRCKPTNLTIFNDEVGEWIESRGMPTLSEQPS
ncbi:MAG TPA: hypothetical protein DCY91_19500 [Cyanobacteria bacterium UBA11370]|nr:hypothetical protein [Cyanobacteria bacterium UBA11370]